MSHHQPGLFGDLAPEPAGRGAYGARRDSLPFSNQSTSRAAAEAALPNAGIQRRIILDDLAAAGAGGLIREEIEDRTGIRGNAVRPRVLELIAAGLIVETDRTRRTRSDREALILVAAEHHGRAAR